MIHSSEIFTFVREERISLEAMVLPGYSFLIGLFKPSTYGGLIPLLLYVASTVGCSFRVEEGESRPQRGLRFRLRESHRLRSLQGFKVTVVNEPEHREGA